MRSTLERPDAAVRAHPLDVLVMRICKDPELELDLAYCVPLGLPFSEFVGAIPTPGEPRWTEHDRHLVHAYRAHLAQRDAGRCQQCGTKPSDWDPDQGGHPYKYVPDVEGCRGCELSGSLRRELEGMPDMANRTDLRIVLVLNPNPVPLDEHG